MMPTLRTLFLWLACLATPLSPALADDEQDRALLAAVTDGDADSVAQLLAAGADPNATFGRFHEDKILCVATAPGAEPILGQLLEAGADANVLYERRDITSADPLTCAMFNRNLEAVKMLHRAGADLERDLCPECPTERPTTVLWSSTGPGRHHILRFMIENTEIDRSEMHALATTIGRRSAYQNDPTLRDRDWIIEWLRRQGFEITPQPVR